jgi:hypothetical protein
MKNFVLLSIYVLFSLLFHSCEQNENINKKHSEVMLIHDEVMPKMKDIHSLKKKLKAKESDPSALDIIRRLDQADEAMMDWMATYHKPSANDTTALGYLADQLIKIKEVKLLMESEISNAQAFVNE